MILDLLNQFYQIIIKFLGGIVIKSNNERLVKIRIISNIGNKIIIKLPINFVKKMINNNAIDFFPIGDDTIESEKILNLFIKAFDYDLVGEIAHIERKNGDSIRIIIDQK